MSRAIGIAAAALLAGAAGAAKAEQYICHSSAKDPAGSVNFVVTLSDKGQATRTKAVWYPPTTGEARKGVLLGVIHGFDLATGQLGAPEAATASVTLVNQKPEEVGSVVEISADGAALGSGGWESDASTIDLSSTMKYVTAVVRIGEARFEGGDLVQRVLGSERVLAVLRAKDGAELLRTEYDLTTEGRASPLWKAAHAEVAGKMKAYRRKCTRRG